MISSKSSLLLLTSSFASVLSIPINDTVVTREALATFTYDPIKTGLVAFGDSYAAGIGAGVTSGDGCRVGSGSYPNQLDTWVKSVSSAIDYQNLPCSGAIATEVLQGDPKSQIDKWVNPTKADRATISIGGNDVGFYNVLTACVLRVGQFWAGKCDAQIGKAYAVMQGDAFHHDVDSLLHQMISKSGRADFRVIHTGYPRFFNAETDSCDYTTFYFWEPGHHGIHHAGDWAYLVKERRRKLNKLVDDLNMQLKSIVDGVNRLYKQPMVLWVDPNPAFEGHRFCEQGITEPDASNTANWLFLASWPDYAASDQVLATSQIETAELSSINSMSIPDDRVCGSSHDWAVQTLCQMKKAGIASNREGGQKGIKLKDKIKLPDDREISITEVRYLVPTKWAKTFHPRSSGNSAYRDLVMGMW